MSPLISPEPPESRAYEVSQRAHEWWLAGRQPEFLFALPEFQDPAGLPLFTSLPLAREFGRVKNTPDHPIRVAAYSLPASLHAWRRRGFRTFTLDRCPHCASAHPVALKLLANPAELGQLWAFTLILREERLLHTAGAAFQSLLRRRLDEIIPKLVFMRDHIDSSCPKAHLALALLHTLEIPPRRAAVLQLAKERLVELGHPDLAAGLPIGLDGLYQGFTLLREMAEGNFDAHPFTVKLRAATVAS